jgi:hypothetical protein
MTNENGVTASPQKQQQNAPPPSPWKKPRGVTLLKGTKSLKRKSDIFNNSGLNNSQNSFVQDGHADEHMQEQSPKRKTFANRFSINTSNLSFGFNTQSPRNDSITEVLIYSCS